MPEKSNSRNLAIKPGKHLTVFIQCSYRCNLNCRYCLADYKEQEGKQEKYFPMDNYKEIIDFVFSEYSERKTFLFNFFGGEPLLSFDLIRGLVPHIRQLSQKANIQVKFAINTNGTLLDREKLIFFKNNDFYLGFSIDGPEHVHNANRPLKSGGSSFHRLIEGIDLAKKYFPLERLKASSMFDRHSMELSNTLKFTTQLGLPRVTIDKAKVSPRESGYIGLSHLPILRI